MSGGVLHKIGSTLSENPIFVERIFKTFDSESLFSSEVEHRICNATAVGSIPTKGSGSENWKLGEMWNRARTKRGSAQPELDQLNWSFGLLARFNNVPSRASSVFCIEFLLIVLEKIIKNAEIAQSVEQRIENPRVTSSILVLGNGRVSEWSMVLVLKTNVARVTVGSNPTPSEKEVENTLEYNLNTI